MLSRNAGTGCDCWRSASATTLARQRGASLANGRHDNLVAAAGARIDIRAGLEPKILAHADAHFTEPPAVAGHRDGIARQSGIGPDKCLLDLVGGDRQRLFDIDEL